MSRCIAGAMGVLVSFAVGLGLAGCAGAGERLPECRGKAVPINAVLGPAATAPAVSDGAGATGDGYDDAH